jgi:hypothetical protein
LVLHLRFSIVIGSCHWRKLDETVPGELPTAPPREPRVGLRRLLAITLLY